MLKEISFVTFILIVTSVTFLSSSPVASTDGLYAFERLLLGIPCRYLKHDGSCIDFKARTSRYSIENGPNSKSSKLTEQMPKVCCCYTDVKYAKYLVIAGAFYIYTQQTGGGGSFRVGHAVWKF